MATYVSTAKLHQLLTRADPRNVMVVRVLSPTKLAMGADPENPAAIIDLAHEDIIPYKETNINGFEHMADRQSRRTGEYWFEIKGERHEVGSLKELLKVALPAIEKAVPGTLEKLSAVKPRSRRIVARDPKDLYDKPHLAKLAGKLEGGWFYGTNNNANETNVWLKRAAELAGLKWGEQLKTSITTTTDDFMV